MIPAEIIASLQQLNIGGERNSPLCIHSFGPLGGGSVNQVFKINTNLGSFCLKYNYANRFPEMFDAEARGLLQLRNAGVIRIPEVISVNTLPHYSYILMEYIVSAKRNSNFMQEFGFSLAELHKKHAFNFGLDHNNYMGSLAQSNTFHRVWATFFIEERLKPQVDIAVGKGLVNRNDLRHWQGLYQSLPSCFPVEKPSLLHGDLWSGNYLVSEKGTACLIDPAVYYGHREADIAMTTLFGGFDKDFYNAYNEAYPMESGWEGRLEIFNLYPLLIHLNLFGSRYLSQIQSVIKKY